MSIPKESPSNLLKCPRKSIGIQSLVASMVAAQLQRNMLYTYPNSS
jgi:hypothetical protein